MKKLTPASHQAYCKPYVKTTSGLKFKISERRRAGRTLFSLSKVEKTAVPHIQGRNREGNN
jgi:hypothetical protein